MLPITSHHNSKQYYVKLSPDYMIDIYKLIKGITVKHKVGQMTTLNRCPSSPRPPLRRCGGRLGRVLTSLHKVTRTTYCMYSRFWWTARACANVTTQTRPTDSMYGGCGGRLERVLTSLHKVTRTTIVCIVDLVGG